MLDLESDTQVDQTRKQVSSRSKLRDSCHACAISKVKCPKEKPSCSKCECRGITCQYFLAKRPGRRRENNTVNGTGSNTSRCQSSKSLATSSNSSSSSNSNSNPNTKSNTDSSRSMEWEAPLDMQPTPGTGLLSKGGTIIPTNSYGTDGYLMTPLSLSVPASPRQDNMFSTNAAQFSVPGEVGMFSGLVDFGSEVNDMDFIMSAMDSPFDLLGMECGGITGSITQTPNDIESLLMPTERVDFDHASLDTPSSLDLLSTSSAASSTASNIHSLPTGMTSISDIIETSPCGCLMQALDLLKKLSTSSTSSRTAFPSLDATDMPRTVNASSAQTVVFENKQGMEAVSSKLACSSCVDDGFLLTVISMIVLKILERYATVAQAQPRKTGKSEPETDNPVRLSISTTSGSDDWMRAPNHVLNGSYDDGGSERVAAQLVLSELHRVQRLVNQLSPKLKGPKEREGQNIAPKMRYWGRPRAAGDGDRMTLTSILAGTLDQMERDVRKSLSTLSAEIINGLRQV
ncbi:hypothetical protein V499_05995 [Pseudogymnoascus sp. VKM F-103]|uniref:Zn(2)-C6 fungal-type domain-containing protein n=1 Tax=Pseudogymnoascus verrucosus TaxID=342668 RepID=A0A1B8GLY1_9PEZI|nr:uncharacterized protein VE01_05548 [Pseudogymnoascus verrucosus]KFY73938.1 hypothetical protein V499_05995 [Pseudogymnoascus sp. VKM F-103]OBT96839.1 hypothetical protein VE01_05548 [Pseudogymnoascus verrucosus]